MSMKENVLLMLLRPESGAKIPNVSALSTYLANAIRLDLLTGTSPHLNNPSLSSQVRFPILTA